MYFDKKVDIQKMKGKVFTTVKKITFETSDAIEFKCEDDSRFIMYHVYCCCENVYIEDICGDLQDLVGSEILTSDESSNESDTDWGTQTWTFYKFATIKGYVDIRWQGESNGYYSESVDLIFLDH